MTDKTGVSSLLQQLTKSQSEQKKLFADQLELIKKQNKEMESQTALIKELQNKTPEALHHPPTANKSTARGRPNTASEEITVAKLVDIPDTADIKKQVSSNPGHEQMKREGKTDYSTSKVEQRAIETFFHDRYPDIIEHFHKNSIHEHIGDKECQQHLMNCHERIRDRVINAVSEQMKDLFSCNPTKPLSEQEKERLRDISEAFGLLLYHYKKSSNLAECIKEQPAEGTHFDPNATKHNATQHNFKAKSLSPKQQLDLNTTLLKMAAVSPPYVLDAKINTDETVDLIKDCQGMKMKHDHELHIRNPPVFTNYLGGVFVKGLLCPGYRHPHPHPH